MPSKLKIEASSPVNLPIPGGLATLETIEAAGGSKVRKFSLLAYTGGKAYIPGRSMPVVFDLSTMKLVDGMPVPLLLDHDNTQPVGHAEAVKISASSITATGYASAETEWRDRVVNSAANGFQWQLSVGVVADRSNLLEIPEGRSENLNGQLLTGPFVLARHAELREITFTATGADAGGAVAKLAASFGTLAQEPTAVKFSQYLTSLGLTVVMLSADALTALRAAWRAANPDAEDDVPQPAAAQSDAQGDAQGNAQGNAQGSAGQQQQQSGDNRPTPSQYEQDAATQVERVEALTSLNASLQPPAIDGVPALAHAIRQRWTPEQFELHALRSRRPQAPAVHTPAAADRDVMQASLAIAFADRLGVRPDHAVYESRDSRISLNASLRRPVNDQFRQRAMDQADRYRGHGMVELFAQAARLNGQDLSQLGHWRSDEWLRAAFSSAAITDMYTQALNARVMASWVEQTSDLMQLVTESDVQNFMAAERKALELTGGAPRPLPNQGVAKDISMSATGEQIRAKMYADRFQFSEQDLIDERFDTLRQAGSIMGQRSRRLLYDLIAYVLIANPTMSNTRAFFNTTDGNLRTSKSLTRDNLISGLTAFETQQENGVNIDVRPTHLIVSRAARFTAAELLSPSALITGENATRSSLNVLAGQIGGVLSDARIDNGFTDPTDVADIPATVAGVPTTWWIADASQPAIELVYVAGLGRVPRLRNGQLGNGQFGFWYDCSMAAGIAPVRRKSVQRNNA
jgi:hypothetical protein